MAPDSKSGPDLQSENQRSRGAPVQFPVARRLFFPRPLFWNQPQPNIRLLPGTVILSTGRLATVRLEAHSGGLGATLTRPATRPDKPKNGTGKGVPYRSRPPVNIQQTRLRPEAHKSDTRGTPAVVPSMASRGRRRGSFLLPDRRASGRRVCLTASVSVGDGWMGLGCLAPDGGRL